MAVGWTTLPSMDRAAAFSSDADVPNGAQADPQSDRARKQRRLSDPRRPGRTYPRCAYAQFTVSLSGRDLAGVVAGLRVGGVSVKMNGEEDADTSENRVPHLVREVRHVV